MRNRIQKYHVRHARVRKKVAGTSARPRMSIKVTNRYMYVQFIDDSLGNTLASATSMKLDGKNNVATAKLLGATAAKCAKEAGIKEVVVDRGGHRYHGRVKAICEAVAESGLLPGVTLERPEEVEGQKEDLK